MVDILHKIGIQSSIENTYEALTTREGLAGWWTHDTEGQGGLGGTLKFRFKAGGGRVVLVSNAPVPEEGVATMLDSRGVPRAAYDAIVASGDIALRHVADRNYRRVFCIGPADRDRLTFKRLTAERAQADPHRIVKVELRFILAGEAPPDRVQRAIDLSRETYCSVWHSLRQDIGFTTSFELTP